MLSTTDFKGKVLDVGGKKENKRGAFYPSEKDVESWEYLNIDETTNPDYLCSSESIPIKDESFDTILLIEVLEHLEKPQATLNEVHRLLKDDGRLIVTMPFLYPLHPDPHDFQRWTPEKIEMEFNNAGLKVIEIKNMGGVFAVINDLIHASLQRTNGNKRPLFNRIVDKIFMPVLSRIFMWLDKSSARKHVNITTGFYVVSAKGQIPGKIINNLSE